MLGLTAPEIARADTNPTGVPPTVSADALPTWQVNGVVWGQVVVGNTVYATGSFTKARPPGVATGGAGEIAAQNIFAYDITTGKPSSTPAFSHSLNAQGLAIAASPDGSRVYVGGDFTTVDGSARNHVAAFSTATGALDSSFAPSVSNQVRALAATSTTLYIGGAYGAVNGVTRKSLAAVNSTNGALIGWAPTVDNGKVWSMVMTPDKTGVVVGGSFTTLNTNSAYGMGRLSATSGASLPWAANQTIQDAGQYGAITSLRADDRQIYGAGYSFGSGTNFEGTFAADPSSGNITVVNDCHGDTYDVLPLGPVLYSVSHAHDCSPVGSYPDTNPRVRWQHALAQTIAPTGTNTGPDSYGWNFNGLPDSTILHWFPQMSDGSYTGQYQAAWSLAGNSSYVVMGGEFPTVNGAAQQGLTRMAIRAIAPNKQGPTYTTTPSRPVPSTTAVSFAPGSARVTFGTAWDYDNESLTYDVLRDGGATPVFSTSLKSNFWTLPTSGFIDTGLAPGSTHSYQVRITDVFGNIQMSPKSNTVTVSSASQSQYAKDVAGDGATHFWRLGEPSGSSAYDWAGFDDLAVNSGVTRGAAGAINGDADMASTFDGSTGSAADTNAVVGPTVFSEEAWFKTTSTTGGKIVSFGDQITGNSNNYDRHIYMNAAGRVFFGVYNNGVYTAGTSSALNDGQWHHVVGTLNSGGITLYVDGKKAARNTGPNSAQPYSGYWRVGGDNINGWGADSAYFNGVIDDVAIYPTALTGTQVATHFTDSGRTVDIPVRPSDAYGAAVWDSSPDSYWRLGERSGSVAKDSSANQADGSYSGGVTYGVSGAVSGTNDTAITVNGADGTVASSAPISNPTVYSEELWFKTTTTQGGKLIGFGTNQTGSSGGYDRHVYMMDDGRLRFGVYTGQLNLADTTGSYNDGTWHHMVATQGSDGMKLYVDSALQATNPQTQAQAYDGFWRVGGDNTWGGASSNYFAGSIDEVAIYSTVLSSNAVLHHYLAGGGTLPNQAPTAAFTSATTNLNASFDATGSTDPDGTVTGYAWDFGDTTAGTSAKPTHSYTTAGTYTVTLTVTDDQGATASTHHDVTVTAAPLALDSFNRTIANGWGTADVGGAWTLVSAASSFNVAGGAGTIKINAGLMPGASLGSVSATNTDTSVQFSFDKVGDSEYIYVNGRGDRNVNGYRTKVNVTPAGAVVLFLTKFIAGTETVLAQKTITGLTYAPGDVLTVRMQVRNTLPTTLQAKVWKSSVAEPTAWAISSSDSSSALQGPGPVGVLGYLSSAATKAPVTLTVKNLSVQTPTG